MDVDVTIGWSKHAFGGWRPGVEQHTETITVDIGEMAASLACIIADAVFEATNHPVPESLRGVAGRVYEAILETGYRGEEAGHYSLSVGDTVTVGETTWACAPVGWDVVS